MTQNQATLQQSQVTETTETRPTTHDGFFSGMLSFSSSYYVTFMSETPQDFDSSSAKALKEDSPSNYVRVDGTGGTDKKVAEVSFSGSWTGSEPMQRTELGYNAYMEWGSWTQPNPMNIGGLDYKFDNKGYYVWGDRTVTMPSSIDANYSGIAHGTAWSAGGGIDKTGTFSMDVHLSPTPIIENFQVWVGGVNNTGFSNGSGSIMGSSFSVTASGTSCVNGGACGGSGSANGAFYGPNAEQAGGVWKATSGGAYANGMFQGTKGTSLPPQGPF